MSDWIEWNGGKCPIGKAVKVSVEFRDGSVSSNVYSSDLRWMHTSDSHGYDIVKYKVTTKQAVDNRKHAHYFKDVSNLGSIDVYRVLWLFGVTDQAIGHAVKKLLVAGGRGAKDLNKDVQEAIDTLQRWQEMQRENADG